MGCSLGVLAQGITAILLLHHHLPNQRGNQDLLEYYDIGLRYQVLVGQERMVIRYLWVKKDSKILVNDAKTPDSRQDSETMTLNMAYDLVKAMIKNSAMFFKIIHNRTVLSKRQIYNFNSLEKYITSLSK